jgi:hypothetical protein
MPMHLVGGCIRRESARIIAARPAAASEVLLLQLPALAQQSRIENRSAATRQRCRMDARRKEAMYRQTCDPGLAY